MYGGGPKRRLGGEDSIETPRCAFAVGGTTRAVTHATGTGTGATKDAVFVSVALSSNRGPDCLQQSEALSFIGH